ncbi:MAG: alanine:cation symporter family protein [Ruminococcaceae bacterium]|nr:alanine:cation symporter family protein [Oscillospiraceae bacterium]
MELLTNIAEFFRFIFYDIFFFALWGDLIKIPLPGGNTLNLSLLVILLIPTGIYFTVRTKGLLIRKFPDMLHIATERKQDKKGHAISGFQSLIVSTATRVGMGNLVGVVAAVSAGGAGAVFWMWITALIGSSTAYIEATLAQKHKRKDPLYGGYHGGPAYYIHDFAEQKRKKKLKKSVIAVLFAISGLICWGGISQVISNSVTSAFYTAFDIPPIWTTVILVAIAAVIVLRKKATVKVLDIVVPIMAAIFFVITLVIICLNITEIPGVFGRIFKEAFGIRQVVAGGFGAVLMNGVKRGLFSNEAGSGSAPCAAAAAETDHIAKIGLLQAFGVFIDTIVICTCTALILLLVPETATVGLGGMELLLGAMSHHMGQVGVIFITITLFLFCFSTFLGVLYYARSNVAYLFGSNWTSQTLYKIFALIMLFIGGLATYTFVWDLGDLGIGLMTVFNLLIIIPMGKEALDALKDYDRIRKEEKKAKKEEKCERKQKLQ